MRPSNEDNYYEILGVFRDASQELIEQVFKQLLNECQDNSEASQQKRVLLEKVYYILGDEMRRYEYDYWSQLGNEKYVSNAESKRPLPKSKIVPSSSLYNQPLQRPNSEKMANRPIRRTTQQHGESYRPSPITLVALFAIIFFLGKIWPASTNFIIPELAIPTNNTNYGGPEQSKNALDLPPNGEIHYFQQAEAIAPLGINTGSDVNYFIKLIDEVTGKKALTIFIRGGESVETKVPLGTYEFRYAIGKQWYGEEQLFGAETVCMKADRSFTFFNDGSQIMGHKVDLIERMNGNLHTQNINKSRF